MSEGLRQDLIDALGKPGFGGKWSAEDVQNYIDGLNAEHDQVVNGYEQDKKSLQAQLDDAHEEISKMEESSTSEKNSISEQLDNAQKELESEKVATQEAIQKYNDYATSQNKKMLDVNSRHAEELKKMQGIIETDKTTIQKLTEQQKKLNDQIAGLKASSVVSRENDDRLKEVKTTLDRANSTITTLRQDVSSKNQQIASLQNQLNAEKAKSSPNEKLVQDRINRAVDEATKKADANARTEMTAEINKLRSQLDEVTKQKEDITRQFDETKKLLAAKTNDAEVEKDEEIGKSKIRVKGLKNEISAAVLQQYASTSSEAEKESFISNLFIRARRAGLVEEIRSLTNGLISIYNDRLKALSTTGSVESKMPSVSAPQQNRQTNRPVQGVAQATTKSGFNQNK